jgi:hypothetical protein
MVKGLQPINRDCPIDSRSPPTRSSDGQSFSLRRELHCSARTAFYEKESAREAAQRLASQVRGPASCRWTQPNPRPGRRDPRNRNRGRPNLKFKIRFYALLIVVSVDSAESRRAPTAAPFRFGCLAPTTVLPCLFSGREVRVPAARRDGRDDRHQLGRGRDPRRHQGSRQPVHSAPLGQGSMRHHRDQSEPRREVDALRRHHGHVADRPRLSARVRRLHRRAAEFSRPAAMTTTSTPPASICSGLRPMVASGAASRRSRAGPAPNPLHFRPIFLADLLPVIFSALALARR